MSDFAATLRTFIIATVLTFALAVGFAAAGSAVRAEGFQIGQDQTTETAREAGSRAAVGRR